VLSKTDNGGRCLCCEVRGLSCDFSVNTRVGALPPVTIRQKHQQIRLKQIADAMKAMAAVRKDLPDHISKLGLDIISTCLKDLRGVSRFSTCVVEG
jgi:hypothetical protein